MDSSRLWNGLEWGRRGLSPEVKMWADGPSVPPCLQVLIQWREVASVRIYYRQRAACTIVEAQKALERGKGEACKQGTSKSGMPEVPSAPQVCLSIRTGSLLLCSGVP